MKSFSLIVPIAANKPVYEHEMPYVFRLTCDGVMVCIKSILGLELDKFDNIYFTILRKHDDSYCISELLRLQFARLNLLKAKVVVLEEQTSSQPETVYRTIKEEKIDGSVFIKDADCFFSSEIEKKNSVAIYPLEDLEWVNPQHKSYVAVDDMFYITNIIEKKIISHYFCAGGYCFENVNDFIAYYESLADNEGLYLSHIIYAMLLNQKVFRPLCVKHYLDFNQYSSNSCDRV